MARVYGSPFDREQQIDRWLRRGVPGLLRGRSERVAPVAFRRHSGNRPVSLVGPDGGDGLPGAQGMSVGWKGYVQVGQGSGSEDQVDTFALSWSGMQARVDPDFRSDPMVTPPPATDIEAIARIEKSTDAGADGSAVIYGLYQDLVSVGSFFQVGAGNGRGGFRSVAEFALTSLTATRRWFVGFMGNPVGITGDPSALTNLIGVGMDSGDSVPQFMVNDGSGSASKVSTGLAFVSDRIYQVRILCSPFSTDAVIECQAYSGTVSVGVASTTVAANLPAVGVAPAFYANNGSAGGVFEIAVISFWCEIQPRADEL